MNLIKILIVTIRVQSNGGVNNWVLKRSLRVSWRGESDYEIRVNHEENERGWDGLYLESLIIVHFLAYVGGLCCANPIFCSLANDVLLVCIVVAST